MTSVQTPGTTLTQLHGKVFMTGIQALVRLPLMQRILDQNAGKRTAGLVSGYRGSPLGAYDQQLWKAAEVLKANEVVFQPGLNEDLAATALWGSQIHQSFGPTAVDGVFGIWYGKGPGVDRTGDVFRTANIMGTSALGGVLAISGDDHAAQSSLYPHQTDGIFQSASMPILQPSNVQEIVPLGLAGIAMSRFAGVWVALKTIAEVVESAASFELPGLPEFKNPEDYLPPVHGLNWDSSLPWPGKRMELERRLLQERLPAVKAWARANRLNRTVLEAPRRRLGIVTVGKAHQDFMQAMAELNYTSADLAAMGVSVYKVAMSWPLEDTGLLDFAQGQAELLVIEEKRGLVEVQIKEILYHAADGVRPRVTGKTDTSGVVLLPEVSELSPLQVAHALVERLIHSIHVEGSVHEPSSTVASALENTLRQRLQKLVERTQVQTPKTGTVIPIRAPFFCSGCPHNTSTKLPEGSVAGAGIGCHVMAVSQPSLRTRAFSQMGGEGAHWIGAAPFSKTDHVFQNLGDGTYQHSGLLAIRAAVAAKVNITYKILYNDAVAMTGGQAAEGVIDPARITRQLAAEGVSRIVLVSDQPQQWKDHTDLAAGVEVLHRDALNAIQNELRLTPGVTALVYEQTCAAEKRRRRKRGEMPDPPRRLFINPRVCEACGDCSVQSNCIAIEPVETAFGRKRRINQSACNKDFSCVKGFCPSFVEVDTPVLKKPDWSRIQAWEQSLKSSIPEPEIAELIVPFNLVVSGVGGSGVLTMGALIAGAAHVQGLASTVLDFTGLAQKNGAVVSQVRLAPHADDIHAVRVGPASLDLLLGADLLVSASAEVLSKMHPGRTSVVVNTGEIPSSDVVTERDASLPMPLLERQVKARCRPEAFHAFDASALSQKLFGDTMMMHSMLLGYAWQKGLIPLHSASIETAISGLGSSVALNLRAFFWGRVAAELPQLMDMLDSPPAPSSSLIFPSPELSLTPFAPPATLLDAGVGNRSQFVEVLINRMATDLVHYQNTAYAERYLKLMRIVRQAEQRIGDAALDFTETVARSAYKLMAYKDEYEVARLYTTPEFKAALAEQFSSHRGLSVYLAPPLFARVDPVTERPRKIRVGAWIFPMFRMLAAFKGLRGSVLDVFGYTHERRQERRLIGDYEQLVHTVIEILCAHTNDGFKPADHPALWAWVIELAGLPQHIRGFGPVKAKAIAHYDAEKARLLQAQPPRLMAPDKAA